MSVFQQGSALVAKVKGPGGKLQTTELLDVCRSILPIVDKLGTGFMIVRKDVGGNIDRLAACCAIKPEAYSPDVFQMVRDDVAAGTHTGSSSVTKGLLWLKRAMEFIVALLARLDADREARLAGWLVTLSTAANETYYATLQQYHGWLVTGTFTVALKLVPSRESFFEAVGALPDDEEAMGAMRTFCEGFSGLLAEVQEFLATNGLDDPAKV